MPEDTGGEKTLPPSPQKIRKAREKGNVARSQDLTAAWSLMVALGVMYAFGRMMLDGITSAGAYYFAHAATFPVERWTLQELALGIFLHTARYLLPVLALMLVGGVTINLIQVGFLFAPQAMSPRLDKLNPVTGMSKFFSRRSLVELVKSILKLAVISYIVYLTFRGRWMAVLDTAYLTPSGLIGTIATLIAAVWFRVVLAMFVIGLLDLGFQRWEYDRELRMTQHEAKEELKEMEGDPRIRQRVRQIQRQLAMQRMMKEVPKADVVVTNPTTYAVALRYDMREMQAPVVVAKGARLMAERIRDMALEHDVPIVEKPDLARTMYRTLELNQPVPGQLFLAVAEVLAFVYQIDRRAEKLRERNELMEGPAGVQARAAG